MSEKAKSKAIVIQGNQACVEGALLAGCSFFAGYPITPATEVAEVMAERMPKSGGAFIQMEDELASINAVIGAAWGGAKAMTATSGPGYSLMQEGIGYAAITETPCVIIDVMRGGPSTGQPTMTSQQDVYQAKYGSHGDYEPIVLVPSSAQEALDMTIRAFNLAEKYLVPVSVLTDEVVGHTRERVVVPDSPEIYDRVAPPEGEEYLTFRPIDALGGVPYRANFGQGYNICVDGQLHDERGMRVGHLSGPSGELVKRTMAKITGNIDDISDYELFHTDDADIFVLAYGSTARIALRSVLDARAQGIKAGLIKLKTLFPFPDAMVRETTANARRVIVPECNAGKICNEVQRVVDAHVESMPKFGGAMHVPSEILDAITRS